MNAPAAREFNITQTTPARSAWNARRALEVLNEGGASHLLMQLFRKLCAPLLKFGSVTFFVCELDKTVPEAALSPGCTVRQASPSDVDRLLRGYDDTKSAQTLLERFRSGDRCIVGIDAHGQVAHCRWIAAPRAQIPELDMELRLGSGEAYFYDGYTRRDSRGQGIDGAVRCWIFHDLRAAGFSRVYSYARSDNPMGLRAARRWQQPVARLWYVRWRGLRALVTGRRTLGRSTLGRPPIVDRPDDESSFRATVWREWFQSWLREPPAKRSTGFHALSEESLASTADHICATLRLDADSDVVLDVGCDSAMVSRFVAKRCKRFVGVDFIPGLLAHLPDEACHTGPGRRAEFLAADGRALPFQSRVFTKAYCSAVLHTLPSREDGLRLVEELVRVCRPGGEVLVAAVPDRGKRAQRFLQAWQQAGIGRKVQLLIAIAVPRWAKNRLRRLLGLRRRHQLVFLEYDLQNMKRTLEARGLACDLVHFPADYWNVDFRTTRSNLLIRIPRQGQDE